MAKPNKSKVDNVTRQLQKATQQMTKMQTKLSDPDSDLTPEEIAELEEAITDFQAKIDRLSA